MKKLRFLFIILFALLLAASMEAAREVPLPLWYLVCVELPAVGFLLATIASAVKIHRGG